MTGVSGLLARAARDEGATLATTPDRASLRAQIPRIRRLVVRLLGRGPDLDDVVQEVLVQCLRGLGSVRDPSAFDDWVASVTTFVVRGAIRSRTRFRRRIEVLPEPPEPVTSAPEGVEALEARRCVEHVQRVLEVMDPELRAAFVLRVLEEVPLASVAAWLGVSLATAKRRISAAEARFWELAESDPYLRTWRKEPDEG